MNNSNNKTQQYFESKLKEYICPICGSNEIYYENPQTGDGLYHCDDCGIEKLEEKDIISETNENYKVLKDFNNALIDLSDLADHEENKEKKIKLNKNSMAIIKYIELLVKKTESNKS